MGRSVMTGRRERGEGQLQTIIWLAVIVAVGYAAFHVGPVYFANYALNDKLAEIGRLPRGQASDEKIYDMINKYLREEELTPYMNRANFTITTMEGHRIITCNYTRTTEVLPGWTKTFVFANKVDQILPY
jgi:hypothetical protein